MENACKFICLVFTLYWGLFHQYNGGQRYGGSPRGKSTTTHRLFKTFHERLESKSKWAGPDLTTTTVRDSATTSRSSPKGFWRYTHRTRKGYPRMRVRVTLEETGFYVHEFTLKSLWVRMMTQMSWKCICVRNTLVNMILWRMRWLVVQWHGTGRCAETSGNCRDSACGQAPRDPLHSWDWTPLSGSDSHSV